MLAKVQAFDEIYNSSAFYFHPRSEEETSRLKSIANLRRLELLANYGDYLGHAPQKIRADLKTAAEKGSYEVVSASNALGKRKSWIDISESLSDVSDFATDKHLETACDTLGLEYKHVKWLIHEYAARNKMFYNSTRLYIERREWYNLAQQLGRDLTELLNVHDREQADKYEKVLLEIKNEFFSTGLPTNPATWLPSQQAVTLTYQYIAQQNKGS